MKEFIFWSGFCSTQELGGKLNGTVNIHTRIHTNIKSGLKYLYSLRSGFMKFGTYFIKGIWRRGTLRWIAKSVTLACYSNSLNSGDESACFRCCLTVWHIGHNVKWRGVLVGVLMLQSHLSWFSMWYPFSYASRWIPTLASLETKLGRSVGVWGVSSLIK